MSWLRKDRDKTEHRYVAERLSAYLDGQLTPEEQAAVDQHVATCEVCRWDLATLRQTVQWTRELPPVPVPRVFTIPMEAQPERPAQPRWRLVPVLQGATALVALLLFFVVVGDVAFRGTMPALVPAQSRMLEQPAVELRATQVVQVEKEMEEPPSADAAAAEKAVSVPEAVPLPEVDAPTVVMSEAPKAPGEAPEAAASEPQAEAASEGASGAPLEEAAEELEAEVQAERVVTETGEIAAGASAEAGGVVLTATLTVSVTEGFVVSPSAPPPTLRLGAERTAATGEPTVVVVASTRALSPTPAASLTIPTTPTPPPTATVDQPLPTSMPVEPTPIPVEAAAEATAAPTLLPQPTSAPTAVAEALEPAGQVEESWYQELAGKRQRMDIDPLRVLEVGLGLMLVLLAAATILLMVQRRRA